MLHLNQSFHVGIICVTCSMVASVSLWSKNCFWPGDLDLWPVTLTFKLDLYILPLDLHAKIKVCMSVRSAVRARHTHRQNDDAKTITPSITSLQQKRVYTSLGSSCPQCVHQSWEEYQRIVLSGHYSEYFPCFVMDFGVRMLDRKNLNICFTKSHCSIWFTDWIPLWLECLRSKESRTKFNV